jgi:hypothetical protein
MNSCGVFVSIYKDTTGEVGDKDTVNHDNILNMVKYFL